MRNRCGCQAAKSLSAGSGVAIENCLLLVYNARPISDHKPCDGAEKRHAGTVAVGQAVRGGIEL